MGNANSANAPPLSHHDRRMPSSQGSSSRVRTDGSGATDRPLRTKKKSLELPDLQCITPLYPHSPSGQSAGYRGRQSSVYSSAMGTQAIPIPLNNQAVIERERPGPRDPTPPGHRGSAEPSTHIPLHARHEESSSRQNGHAHTSENGNGTAYDSGSQRRRTTRTNHDRPQDNIYVTYENQAHPPSPPPPSRNPSTIPETPPSPGHYRQITVHSSIPQPPRKDDMDVPVPVKVSWNGGGHAVYLIRAGEDEKNPRRKMFREHADGPHLTTLFLTRGTHHLRFLVDEQWRVADDLPAAVDEMGSLANYVAVGLDGGIRGGVVDESELAPDSQPASPLPHPPVPGQSFWSRASTVEEGDESIHPPTSSVPTMHVSRARSAVVWTNEIPLELCEAAVEEEQYLQATSSQYHNAPTNNGRTQVISGFVPLPQIPPAPTLPRHLEKLILNTKPPTARASEKAAAKAAAAASSGAGPGAPGTPQRKCKKTKERGRPLHGAHSGKDTPPGESGSAANSGANSAATSVSTSPTTPTQHRAPSPSPSQNITVPLTTPASLDDMVIADDNSVLPVPSHVVLHHLSTSAIKNGVLAVGQTVRYRKKYLTTVYYKPTEF